MIEDLKTGISRWKSDAALAFGVALVALSVNAATGFGTLSDYRGDNDSLLRLVQTRDLLAGQGWYDMTQYRMGLDGGFAMHWSRLVDAPIAAIILVASLVTGSAAIAETTALILWPMLMFAAAVYFLLRIARMFGGQSAVLPAVAIGGSALHFIGNFSPGGLDHHNVQLTACLACLYYLMQAQGNARAALLSGACAAIMLAVGMETAPYVATVGICAAALFLFGGDEERQAAQGFGCGFAGVAALAFVATVPASAWGQTQCDAFSLAHFVLAGIAGCGLAAIASVDALRATRGRRIAALGVLALGVASVAFMAFPQCLSAPFADLDSRLKVNWLDHVSEAQSLFQIIMEDPAQVAARYGTPLLALVLLALRFWRGDWRRQDFCVGALMLAAFLVSVWQVRGSVFSISLAVIPLSAWVGDWRRRAETSPSPRVSAKMVAVWLVSVNAIWTGAAGAAASAFENKISDEKKTSSCEAEKAFSTLARLSPANVLAVSNLGSPILAYTGHHAFSGPYHRNIDGNLLAMDAFMGSPAQARRIVERHRVGLVALCPGNAESALFARRAPDGFAAILMRGEVPDWLEIMPETSSEPLRLYRVVEPG